MTSDAPPPVEGGQRSGSILGEILDTPVAKEILAATLSGFDGDAGRLAVRHGSLDPELVLSVLSQIPGMLNYATGAATELARQLDSQLTPRLAQEALASFWSDLDQELVVECVRAWGHLASKVAVIAPEVKRRRQRDVTRKAAQVVASAVNGTCRRINTMTRQDPHLLTHFAADVASRVDRRELEGATQVLSDALRDKRVEMMGSAVKLGIKRVSRLVPRPGGWRGRR